MSEYDLWSLLFDEAILDHIQQETTLYARRDKNLPTFRFTMKELEVFLGIIILSGYHNLPSERDLWSKQPDLGVPLVAEVMSRDRFTQIKSCLHLEDNHSLHQSNKVGKVTPLYDLLNTNLKKYGFFHSILSIDESMVPYYGKHSAKMFLRLKPIRFGYKLWVLAGTDGYSYQVDIYTGKSTGEVKGPLGFRVVDSLLAHVKQLSDPTRRTVFFDNFFTSYDLLRHLHGEGFKATGTIRKNRSGGAIEI